MAAIAFWEDLSLTHDEMGALGEDVVAVLALVSLAANETNILRRLFLLTPGASTGKAPVDFAILSQQMLILRIWTSKLFEFIQSMEEIAKDRSKSLDPVRAAIREHSAHLDSIRAGRGWTLARNIRNEAAFHYKLEAARKNLRHIEGAAQNPLLYLHKMEGNCLYPLGEEIMFYGRLDRMLNNKDKSKKAHPEISEDDRRQIVDDWMQWALEANRFLSEVSVCIVKTAIFDRFPEKFPYRRDYWFDEALVGQHGRNVTPVVIFDMPHRDS